MNIKKTGKEIWRKHKGAIIVGTIVVSGTVIYLLTKKGGIKTPDLSWMEISEDEKFSTLESAIEKFKEMEKLGDVALFSERGTYVVLDV